MSPDRRIAHLSAEAILDLLEDRLGAGDRREAEAHLGLPCPACRERLLALGALVSRMRADTMEQVPEALRRAAIDLFPGASPAVASEGAVARGFRLAFDSLTRPLAAATLRTVGEARRLRFEHGEAVLELECEPESADQCVVRGRLVSAEPELQRIEVTVRGERLEQWTGTGGVFLFEGLPRGETRLTVRGPDGPFETPPFET